MTGLSYTQGTSTTPNTLTLTNGTTTVGRLDLAGSYGASPPFHLDASANGATAVISLQSIGVGPHCV